MKLSMTHIIQILLLQRDRWMHPSLKYIHTKKELIEKITDDFLSENDITDKSELFKDTVCCESVSYLRREITLVAIRYHYPDYDPVKEGDAVETSDIEIYPSPKNFNEFLEILRKINNHKENKNANSN